MRWQDNARYSLEIKNGPKAALTDSERRLKTRMGPYWIRAEQFEDVLMTCSLDNGNRRLDSLKRRRKMSTKRNECDCATLWRINTWWTTRRQPASPSLSQAAISFVVPGSLMSRRLAGEPEPELKRKGAAQ